MLLKVLNVRSTSEKFAKVIGVKIYFVYLCIFRLGSSFFKANRRGLARGSLTGWHTYGWSTVYGETFG